MKLSRFPLSLIAILAFVSAGRLVAEEAAYGKAVTITPLLKSKTDAAGQPLLYPANAPAEVTAVIVEIAPGRETGWHHHPVPCLAYILEGELAVELETGEVKSLKAGQAFCETVNISHNGMNHGEKPARLVFFALSTEGQPYAVKDGHSH